MMGEPGMVDKAHFEKQLYRVFSKGDELNDMPLEHLLDAIPRLDAGVDLPPGTAVLVRMDLDVPLDGEQVTEMSRIESNEVTLNYCRERGWKTILCGHLGRDKEASLAPVCRAMSAHFGMPIQFIGDWLDEAAGRLQDDVVEAVSEAASGAVFMLENTRRYNVERVLWNLRDEEFPSACDHLFAIAEDIANRLADVQVNEAIAASNIDASSAALPLAARKTFMGFFLAEEMQQHIRGARSADAVVFSGLKINKLDDFEGIMDRGKLKMAFVAGSLAMALLKARDGNFSMGRAETDTSLKAYIEPERIDQARRILEKGRKLGVEFVLPVDFVLDNGTIAQRIPADRVQMDVGPKTNAHFAERIGAYSSGGSTRTLFYNGVFGAFEDERFAGGTRAFIPLLKQLSEAGVKTYVGGGEGRTALLKYGNLADVTHAFTCGGTVLKSLSNFHIAYLKTLYLQNCEG